MITIYDSADMVRALASPIDESVKTILLERLRLLSEYLEQWPFEQLLSVIIVEPGDRLEAIEVELGISIFHDALGEVRYPDAQFVPAWEFCIRRNNYFDVVLALDDSGQGIVLLVADKDGVIPELRTMLKQYATT